MLHRGWDMIRRRLRENLRAFAYKCIITFVVDNRPFKKAKHTAEKGKKGFPMQDIRAQCALPKNDSPPYYIADLAPAK